MLFSGSHGGKKMAARIIYQAGWEREKSNARESDQRWILRK